MKKILVRVLLSYSLLRWGLAASCTTWFTTRHRKYIPIIRRQTNLPMIKPPAKSRSHTYCSVQTQANFGRSYKGRTDTMIVMVLNPKIKNNHHGLSPRDTKVDFDDVTIKINAAYSYGSSDTAMEAVEKLLNIKLDGYLLVNMKGLEQMVDAVGGVTVTSPLSFDYEGKSFVKGQSYDLNGSDALKFSRMRYDDPQGDYGRQMRQQLIFDVGYWEA